jgi:hypothetical protein
MGLRFHKSLKLIPGVRLNLSKGMPSVSVGGKGLTFNIGKKGAKTTVGLPGTGLSYSETTSYKNGSKGKVSAIVLLIIGALLALAVNYIRS